MLETNSAGATVIYLYGTCLDDSLITLLAKRLSMLPTGTKIITVSFALEEYFPYSPIKLVKSFPAKFTWGVADVYVQQIKKMDGYSGQR